MNFTNLILRTRTNYGFLYYINRRFTYLKNLTKLPFFLHYFTPDLTYNCCPAFMALANRKAENHLN